MLIGLVDTVSAPSVTRKTSVVMKNGARHHLVGNTLYTLQRARPLGPTPSMGCMMTQQYMHGALKAP